MPQELSTPLHAVITTFDATDQVGTVRLTDGEVIRFGRSACKDFVPSVGMVSYITVVDRHPLGGRKGVALRSAATTEAEVRTADAAERSRRAADAENDLAQRRERIRPQTTPEAILARMDEAVDACGDADVRQLYELADDLALVGPTLEHVEAILRGIAAHPLVHFGNPGPLVHFLERFDDRGYQPLLREIASSPAVHFVWMLGRYVNAGVTSWPLDLLIGYRSDTTTPSEIRELVAQFLADLERRAP